MELKRKYKFLYYLVLVLIFTTTSCREEKRLGNSKNLIITNDIKKEVKNRSVFQKKITSFHLDSIVVNKKIPFYGSLEKLKRINKITPDSTYKNVECGNFYDEESSDLIYFGNSIIEVSKNNYAFSKIDVSDDYYITYSDSLIIDNKLSIKEFTRKFSFVNKYNEYFEELNSNGVEFTVKECNECDSFWRFLFINNKLTIVWYFIPC